MVIAYSRVWINRVRLPILLARGQLNRENEYSPIPVRAWEFRLAGRVQPSRPTSSAFSSSYSDWIWCLLTGFLPSSAAASIYETAIRHRVSPEFIGSRNCVPMAFTAESPPAQHNIGEKLTVMLYTYITVISSEFAPPLSSPPPKKQIGRNGHKNVELSRGDIKKKKKVPLYL